MAEPTKVSYVLKITYLTTDGSSTIHTWRYANTDAPASTIQALVSATLANADLFARKPASAKEAKYVTTEEYAISLS